MHYKRNRIWNDYNCKICIHCWEWMILFRYFSSLTQTEIVDTCILSVSN